MEKLTILQIIVKDSPQTYNKNNKNLFKFLNLNYQEIIQSNYYIQLILLDNSNFRTFKPSIKNTPALINTLDNNREIGTYNIINYLIKLCEGESYDPNNKNNLDNDEKNFINEKNKISNFESNDSLHDFLLNEALNVDDTIEEPLDLNKVKDKENFYKLKQEKQKSTNVKLKKNMINTLKNNQQNQSSSIDNLPKDEKNVFDNKELTDTRPVSDYMSDDKDLQKFWENMDET